MESEDTAVETNLRDERSPVAPPSVAVAPPSVVVVPPSVVVVPPSVAETTGPFPLPQLAPRTFLKAIFFVY